MSDTSVQPTPDLPFETAADPIPSGATIPRRTPTEAVESLAHPQNDQPHEPSESSLSREVFKYVVSFLILSVGAGMMYGLILLKTPPETQNSNVLIPKVKTRAAAPYTGKLTRVISGTVVPYREIRVAAEISGKVITKYDEFEAGNYVKHGTKLLEIDPRDYQLQLETGLAEVEQSKKIMEETAEEIVGAERSVGIAEKERDSAQAEYDRNVQIESALSISELDQSRRNMLSFESALISRKNSLGMLNARLLRMKASLDLSNAQLNRTRLNLTKTSITAPADGVIVREIVQEGDFVRTGDELVMFEDVSRSEVICNLTPTDLAWVRKNSSSSARTSDENSSDVRAVSPYYIPKTKVTVFEPGEPSVQWEGFLERFDGIGRDESTRTIPCRITIQEPIHKSGLNALVRGMYVKCKITVKADEDNAKRTFLKIPAVALRPDKSVWVFTEDKSVVDDQEADGRIRNLPVEVVQYLTLKGEKQVVIVEDSVKSNDQIVVTALSQPTDNARVVLETGHKEDSAKQVPK